MRGAVLAGIWGAGKTSTYRRTLAALAGHCDHLLALPQAATVTTATYTSGTPAQHADTVHTIAENLTTYLTSIETRWQASSLPRHRCAARWTPTLLLEAGPLDLPVYRHELGPVSRPRAAVTEQRLADLGIHLVMLNVPEQHVRAQCVESTRAQRSSRWDHYLRRFGEDDEQTAAAFIACQRELIEWVNTSPMPHTVIDTSDRAWDSYAAEVTELILG